ncbi:MAG: hypothetical protein M4579_004215 [Chaenotheca gracillima]|nr:MAG: hypothetical protein M4579_004215 [Chaenotheca gracillima]
MAPGLPYRQPSSGRVPTSDGSTRTSFSSFPASQSATPRIRPRLQRPSPPSDSTQGEMSRSSDGSTKTPQSAVSSQNSSLSAGRHGLDGMHRTRRLKSQYPREESENHVEYILVASFHIDRGPIMEHQYPSAIGGDEHMLAELMLPDQAHVRNQDWTIFFLHKDVGGDDTEDVDEDSLASSHRKRKKRKGRTTNGNDRSGDEDTGDEDGGASSQDASDEEEEEEEAEGGEGPPLIYVLNLVNTKQDTTAKRGAVVKAMAICTRHSFLHIYKPLLLLALEEYFKAPVPETLESLYNAVNSMDLSLMPRLSVLERYILHSSDTKDMFVEKFEQMIQQRMEEERNSDSSDNPKAIESASPHPPYLVPRDTREFETKVLYNRIPIPIKVPTAPSPETVGDFSIIKLIQIFSGVHTKDPQPFMLHPHLTTGGPYTHPVIVLANAMLTQKRVMFLGHNRPSGEVAEAVLAACALASGGILRGFTRHAFPYTDLSKIDDLLKVPGFIAGVTNPAFANHPEWWDLLCDIPTGRMKISNRIEAAPITEGLLNFQQQNPSSSNAFNPAFPTNAGDATGDQAFMDEVLRGMAARHGEANIRSKWRDWVVKLTRIAAAFEESVYGASALYIGSEEADAENAGVAGHGYVWTDETTRQRELAGNISRIEGWRNTRSYYSYIQDLAQLYTARPIKSLDLHHLHDRLRAQKLPPTESGSIYLAFGARIHSYAEICQLLTVTPESHAGLFYLSLGLFHPRREVRIATVELLERIQVHLAGRHFWNSLGRFAKLAFFRLKREREGDSVGGDAPAAPTAVGTGASQMMSGAAATAGGGMGGIDARVGGWGGRRS